jgi:uncharacterized repeat protein (TIGR01451 family)
MMFITKQAGLLQSARSWGVLGLLLVLAVISSTSQSTYKVAAQTQTVTIILNTGYNNNTSTVILPGGLDDDWKVIVDPKNPPNPDRPANVVDAYGAQPPSYPIWVQPFPNSQWISAAPDSYEQLPVNPQMLFTYELCFNLPAGFSNPQLNVQLRADDMIDQVHFGTNTFPGSTTAGSFNTSQPPLVVTTTTGFQAGLNCLTVEVKNTGGGPTGLLVAGTVTYDISQTTGCVQPPSGMVAWWPLDETSGTTVTDIVGGFNGTALPGPIGPFAGSGPVTSSLWPPPTFPPGMVGTSLFFYGNRHVKVPHNTALDPGTGDFTVDAWVIYASAGQGQNLTVVKKANPPSPGWWQLIIRDTSTTSGKLRFDVWAAPFGVGPEVNITPNTWHHVAATLKRGSPDTITLYVDGIGTSFPVTIGLNVASSADLLIGGDGVFAGEIAVDEVEIFNRALDKTKIEDIFNAGSAGKCKIGTVVINKSAVGGDDTFSYTATGSSIPSSFSITTTSGSGSQTFSNLASGSYTVTEQGPPSPWVFTSLVCTDPDGGTTVSGQTATIDLDPGETVTCTFTNSKQLPDLTINKQVMCSGPVTPQGIKCTITFTITNNGPGTFNGILVINDTVTPPPSPGISWAGSSTVSSTSGVAANWSCGIGLPTYDIGCGTTGPVTLGPSGNTTFSVNVYIPGGQYQNCVTVRGYAQFPYTPSNLIQEVTFNNNQHCVDFQSGELKKCDLEISKSLAHGIVPPLQPGQQVTFEIIVTNVGTGPCDPPIPVTDTFTGMTYQSGGQIMGPWTCPPGSSATPVTCNYSGTSATPLQPGQSSNFFVSFTVTAKPGEAVENCAEVKHPNDTNPNNNKACIKVPVAEPKEKCDLKITKTVQPNPVQSGQQVTITLTVQNVGTGTCPPGPFPGTVVSDPRPSGLTFNLPVSISQSGGSATWQCGLGVPTGDLSCATQDPLPPGYSATFTFTATVTAPPGSNIQNCATVSNQNDANPANNKSCVTITVTGGVCDREIKKTVTPNPVKSGDPVIITLTVTNVGTAPCPVVPGINVADPQPSGLTFQPPVSANKPGWSCGFSGPGVIAFCTSTSPLLPGPANAVTITFTAKVTAPPGSQIQNCAEVTNVGDAVQTNNKSCVTINVIGLPPPPDLALVKLLDGQLRVEKEATYVLRVTNGGGGPTSGPIVVSDPLPSGLRFVSASGPGWSCAAQGQNVTCRAAGPIQPGQTSTILLRVRVAAPAGTQITNCATVETAGDANPANNRSCHTGTVQR